MALDKNLAMDIRHSHQDRAVPHGVLIIRTRREGMMRRNGSVSELGARVVAKYLPTWVSLSSGPSTST
jgi:hypothetical protein